MTAEAHAWLPPVAILDGVLAHQVDGVLQSWSRRWLPAPTKLVSKAGSVGSNAASDALWQTRCGKLVFALDHQKYMRLGSATLGLRKPWGKSDPRDLALLRSMTFEALNDLCARLAPVCQSDTQIEPLPEGAKSLPAAMSISASISAGRLFDLNVSWEAAVAARKSVISAASSSPPLTSRHIAIAEQEVRVGAFVGSGRMELSDLRALAPGDVLVLDRGLDDAFGVAVNGRPIASDDYEIKRNGAQLSLQTSARLPSGGVQ